jgi:hypothetical protein
VASGKSRGKVEVKKRKMRVRNRRNAFEAGSDIFVAEFGGLRVEAEGSLFIEKKVERGGSNVNKRWPHVIKIRKEGFKALITMSKWDKAHLANLLTSSHG